MDILRYMYLIIHHEVIPNMIFLWHQVFPLIWKYPLATSIYILCLFVYFQS
jgi:hypothetical protein